MNPQVAVQPAKVQVSLQVLNPVVAHKFRPVSPAKRSPDLSGKKIGLYWNYKKHGDVALRRVQELLSERYGDLSFQWLETGPVNEASEEWFESVRLSGVMAVVATTGD